MFSRVCARMSVCARACMCVCCRLSEKVQTLVVLGGLVNRLLGISPFFLQLSLFVPVVDPKVVTSYIQDTTFWRVVCHVLRLVCVFRYERELTFWVRTVRRPAELLTSASHLFLSPDFISLQLQYAFIHTFSLFSCHCLSLSYYTLCWAA